MVFVALNESSRHEIQETDLLPDDLDPTLKLVFVVLYLSIIALALVGNGAVLAAVALNRKMRTVTNTFVVSLAVSDTLIAGLNMPVQLAYYVQNEWTMGEALCKFSKYVQGVVIVSSILTLTGIAVDRYYAICYPLKARHIHTVGRALRLVCLFWLIACALVSPQLFVQRLEPLIEVRVDSSAAQSFRIVESCAEYFPDHRLNVAYTLFSYCALYLLPVTVVMATYTCIALKLRKRQRRPEVGYAHVSRPLSSIAGAGALPEVLVGGGESQQTVVLRDRKVIVRMLVAIVLLFSVSWFPFFTGQVYLLFDDYGHRRRSTRTAMAVFQLVGYSNSCTNSVVYCFLSENFQKQLCRRCSSSLGLRRRRRWQSAAGGGFSRAPLKTLRGRWGGSVETGDQRTDHVVTTSVHCNQAPLKTTVVL